MKNYDEIFMVAVTHKQELFYSEFKEMYLPPSLFFNIFCMCGVSTSKGTYIQLIPIKLLIGMRRI